MNIFIKIFACLVLCLTFSVFVNAQGSNDNWIRIQSDNGEFSIEVPKFSTYFFDKDGFSTSNNSKSYQLKNMHMLNSYQQGSLLSFEAYETGKGGLEAIIEADKQIGNYSEFDRSGVRIKQLIRKADGYYFIRQYFNSKKFIYILTAASRTSETAATKRFLDSLIFNPDLKTPVNPNIPVFSGIKPTNVVIEFIKKSDKSEKNIATQANTDAAKENPSKLTVMHRPRAGYIDSARMKAVQGTIKLRTTFSAEGYISKIEVHKTLPEGLLRQSIFAALRIKFIPQEENGQPTDVTKFIEYRFEIY
ncbi:MAG: TonB family protein [Acidobacteria bacterium]|nr:TonB family protein [Acidobacteriota bacterium]